jgi:hypothetical protein
MKTLFLTFCLVVSMLLIACSSNQYYAPKPQKTVDNKFTVMNSFDGTWQNLVNWFTDHNIAIKIIDKNSGSIITDYNLSAQDRKKYADCGKFENGELGSLRFGDCNCKLSILASKIDDSSVKVEILCFFETAINEYDSKNKIIETYKVDCNTTGVLEKEIYDAVK